MDEARTLDPAPGAEQHPALDLANSVVVLPGGHVADLLDTPEAAGRWLATRDLAPADARLFDVCAARLRTLRGHVRELLDAAVACAPPSGDAIAAVNDAFATVPTAALLSWDADHGLHRVVPHPTDQVVDRALGVLAADAADLLTGPDVTRLAACGAAPCQRLFVRSGRRTWCSVRCGDRVRAARAYARRTGVAG